jgi:hypothetical protein
MQLVTTTLIGAATLFFLAFSAGAQEHPAYDWCDCMRYKKSTFQTQPWTSERAGRCTRFAASTREACRAQGKGGVLDLDAQKKK